MGQLTSAVRLLRRPEPGLGFALVVSIDCQLQEVVGFRARDLLLGPCTSQIPSLYSLYIRISSIIGDLWPLWLGMGRLLHPLGKVVVRMVRR